MTRDGDRSRTPESALDGAESETDDVADAGADVARAEVADAAAAAAEDADEEVGDADEAKGGSDVTDAENADSAVEGVDTEHVMNLTFVLTLLFGVPAVVVLSLFVPLDGWDEIVVFVVRVGAAIWFLTAVGLYVRERWLK